MNDMAGFDAATRKIANSFFGHYPRWEQFLGDVSTVRDTADPVQKKKEAFVRIALTELAYLAGISNDDIIGSYEAAQSKGPGATFFKDQLFGYYKQAFKAYFGVEVDLNPSRK